MFYICSYGQYLKNSTMHVASYLFYGLIGPENLNLANIYLQLCVCVHMYVYSMCI